MFKKYLYPIAAVALLIIVLGAFKTCQIMNAISQGASFTPPPEAVTSIVIKKENWQDTIVATGSIAPVQGVTLSAEEPGKVVKIGFDSGTPVKQGDILVELDTTVEEANLKSAQAVYDLAVKNMARMQALNASKAVSKEDYDNSQAKIDQSRGEVAALQALIAKKKIAAPFAGKAGIRMVNVGQYLAAGTAITPLYSLESVYIDFSLPQQDVGKVKVGDAISFSVDAYPNREFIGKIAAINPQIDTATRTVMVQATASNSSEELRPGMFAKVKVLLPTSADYVTVPSSSINFAPYGDSVFVIEKMKDAHGKEYDGVRQQVVKLGDRRGEQVAIVSGLTPGQEIVTSGVFKLRPQAAVVVNNDLAPGNKADVQAADT